MLVRRRHRIRAEPILSDPQAEQEFGSLVIARDIDLDVHPFVLHSIIGPNGAGKTTFFNMLCGTLAPTGGQIMFDGKDITRPSMHGRAGWASAARFRSCRSFRT